MQQVRLSSFTYLINRIKSVGYCISTSGLFVFKKCCSFKKAVGLKVSRYGIIVPLYGMMMSPYCVEASPCGTMTSPHGMMTVPYGMMTSPYGMMTSPYGMMSVPHGMMMIPYGTMMIPSDISGMPRVGFNHLSRLDAGLMKLFQQLPELWQSLGVKRNNKLSWLYKIFRGIEKDNHIDT